MAIEKSPDGLVQNPENLKANSLLTLRDRISSWDNRRIDLAFMMTLATFARAQEGPDPPNEVRVGLRALQAIQKTLDLEDILLTYGAKPGTEAPQLSLDDDVFNDLVQTRKTLFTSSAGVVPEKEDFLETLQDDATALQALQLLQRSRRVYELSATTANLYRQLNFKEWTWAKTPLPFGNFVVEFPSVLQVSPGNFIQLHGILVSQLHDIDDSFPADQIEIQAILSPFRVNDNEKLIRIPKDGRTKLLKAIRDGTRAIERMQAGSAKQNYLDSIRAGFRSAGDVLHAARRHGESYPKIDSKILRIPLSEPIVNDTLSPPMNMLRKIVAAVCLEIAYVKGSQESAPGPTPQTKDRPPTIVIPPGKKRRL